MWSVNRIRGHVLIFVFILSVLLLLRFYLSFKRQAINKNITKMTTISSMMKEINMTALDIPKDVIDRKKKIEVTEGEVVVNGARVFCREAQVEAERRKSSLTLLLLHGKSYSSKTWLDLGTIQMVGAMGYRTIAIDIPGYGKSPASKISKENFINDIINVLDIREPVIVSPSMSGYYSLPFLINYSEKLSGYIPVAPVGIKVLENLTPVGKDQEQLRFESVYKPLQKFLLSQPIPDLSFIHTPVLVVFGERDHSKSSALLNLLPNSQIQEIPNGNHAAYLDDPNLWHKLLYNFLHNLSARK